jgi:hypothetical protein
MRLPIQSANILRHSARPMMLQAVYPAQGTKVYPSSFFRGSLTIDPRAGKGEINQCGPAGCLCTGLFCADLIKANYCSEFKCAEGGPCLCIF